MCMSGLDRRVQILVDPDQYAELEREAHRTGRSVAAVIRQSITDYLLGLRSSRSAAGERLHRSADPVTDAQDDWAATKTAMERDLAGKLP
jgi:hypothetical protein